MGTVALSGNQASFPTSFATTGTRSITAIYAGDTKDPSSTSAALSQSVIVKFATTTKLTSSPNPSDVGLAMTLTETTSSSGGTPPDGEAITFKEEATVLGTMPLAGSSDSFTTSSLTVGMCWLSLKWRGDVFR